MEGRKCITFCKSNHKGKHHLTITNQILQNNNEYKYLGITINKKRSFLPILDDLNCKAKRAIYSINSKINIRFLSVKTLLKNVDSLICPLLLYGSEVWEPYLKHNDEKWNQNSIVKVHVHSIKRILCLNRFISNAMVRGETERILGLNRFTSNAMVRGESGKILGLNRLQVMQW